MCGFAGFVGEGNVEHLKKMLQAIRHRGPDAEGIWSQNSSTPVFLGHRRLAILDIAGGNQPMTAPNHSVLVFNGEIFNHQELRKELTAKNQVFHTSHSDTETLLHALSQWGTNILPKLNGMWAFAFFNPTTHQLLLGRDHLGKKPLYYAHTKSAFIFGSELKALLAHPHCPRNESTAGTMKYLAYGYLPGSDTCIEGIQQLLPGHYLILNTKSMAPTSQKQYWKYTIAPQECAISEATDKLAELLLNAVRNRLLSSDVPVGYFLSGGLDSSLVAAIGAKTQQASDAFCIAFDDPSFDERKFAIQAARHTGHRLHTYEVTLNECQWLIPRLGQILDHPLGDSSYLPTYLLSAMAAQHYKVVLSGDGGDELFAGYDPIVALSPAQWLSKLPLKLRQATAFLANSLPVSHKNISFDFKVKRFLAGLTANSSQWLPRWMAAGSCEQLGRIFGTQINPEWLYSEAINAWNDCPSPNPVDRASQFFTRVYLPGSILTKIDRASMQHGLEVRSPFLDLAVVEFSQKLPAHYKLRHGVRKWLLKKVAKKWLPDSLIHRKKKGFGMPIGAWLKDDLPHTWEPKWKPLVAQHKANLTDNRLLLWAELVHQKWKQSL